MVLKKIKDFTNSGFGSNINNEGERLITKNGQFNIEKKGLNFFGRFDLFHWLMNLSSIAFFSFLVFGFIAINLLFTATYLLIGMNGIAGTTPNNEFFDALYFSFQTLTTVGYGGLHPTGRLIGIVSGFEAFIGLLSFAVSTGLLYGRFSKPKNKLLFSTNALISPYQEITGLMARVANPKKSQLINTEAKMVFSQIEGDKRKFYTLDLEMNSISLFATSWTVVHPITNESPLFSLTKEQLIQSNAELILLINAYDETYNQPIYVRTSYKPDEIVENAKFSPILGHNEQGQSVICLDRISEYQKV